MGEHWSPKPTVQGSSPCGPDMENEEINDAAKNKEEVKEPSMYNVIFVNDNYTPLEFVVELLASIFNKDSSEAMEIATTAHEKGEAVVGTFTYDIAKTKSYVCKKLAKKNGFPLKVKVKAA